MPTEKEVLASLRRRLPELLPTLRLAVERPSPDAPWDLVLKVRSTGRTRRLVCEVKSVGEPRYLAQAITSLRLAARTDPRLYPVVVAPYISPEGRRLCHEAGIGYLDLTGNVFLRFNGILVDRLSGEAPPRAKARLRRLFAPKSSRILRVLLEDARAEWTLARLADEAALSLRTAHLVVNALEEKAFVEKRRGAIRLQKPGELLGLWAQNYSLESHRRYSFYTFVRNPAELAAKLTTHAVTHKEAMGLTLHSGAAFVAPFVRSPDVHAYFAGDRARLLKALDLRAVESGGTVHLLEPYDEGVFYRIQTIRGVRVVCNTQLYLDLVNFPARGREQAQALRRQKLRY
ncbi:MAG: type IV toxin-antitoxin system AbiEi family antitoxin [Anaerolineae bacterium]